MKSGNLEVWKSRIEDVRKSGSLEVRKSGSLEVWKSGSQDVRMSGSQEVRKSDRHFLCSLRSNTKLQLYRLVGGVIQNFSSTD